MSIKGKLLLVRGGAKPSRFGKKAEAEVQYPVTRYNHLTPKKVNNKDKVKIKLTKAKKS